MRRSVLALLLSVALVACDTRTGPGDDHLGTYTLRQINDRDLPFTVIRIGEDSLEVVEARITLDADSAANDSYTFRVTADGATTIEPETRAGTYTVTSSVIAVRWNGTQARESFIRRGRTLRLSQEGFQFEFER